MDDFLFLVPIALGLGLTGLASFMWTLRDGQYDDLQGAAERILLDEDDRPLPTPANAGNPSRPPWTP
jgi:cbb3-type cytochrome oxidase maturation protein